MSTHNTKQSGFSMVIGVIAAVLVIAVVGFVGLRLYNQSKQGSDFISNSHISSQLSQSSNNQNSIPAQPVDPNAGYIVIKEWDVRFKPVSGLSSLSYTITSSQRPNAVEVMFMTDQLKATTIPECNGITAGSRPLGAMVRTSTAEDLSQHLNSDQLLAHINGYYYYYYEPSQLCDPDPNSNTINDLQNNTLSMIKTSLASLGGAK